MPAVGGPETTVSLLREVAAEHPDRAAFVEVDRRLSFSEWDRAADGVAALFADRGVGPGDVVALLVPSSIDYAVCYQAAMRLRAITTGINTRLGPPEIASILDRTEPRVVIRDVDLEAVRAAYSNDPPAELPHVRADDPVAIVYEVGNNNSSSNEGVKVVPTSAPPQDSTTTTVALKSVKGKPCVGLKDPLPKGAPPMLLSPGPAPTKLVVQDLKVGTGAVVPANAKVTMNYIGVSCSTGKIFDSTYAHNQTFPADLSSTGNLIKGWQQGIPGMKVGGVRILAIPPALGYGAHGNPPTIAPDEALYFLVSAEKLT